MYSLTNECTLILDSGSANLGNLYLGGTEGLKKVPQLGGVMSVIDNWCYKHFRVREQCEHMGINHHHWFDREDEEDVDIGLCLREGSAIIDQWLQQCNVYVHCRMGISRSASLVIAYIMTYKGISYEEAYALVLKCRPIICPNDGFVKQLKLLEQELIEKRTIIKEKL